MVCPRQRRFDASSRPRLGGVEVQWDCLAIYTLELDFQMVDCGEVQHLTQKAPVASRWRSFVLAQVTPKDTHGGIAPIHWKIRRSKKDLPIPKIRQRSLQGREGRCGRSVELRLGLPTLSSPEPIFELASSKRLWDLVDCRLPLRRHPVHIVLCGILC